MDSLNKPALPSLVSGCHTNRSMQAASHLFLHQVHVISCLAMQSVRQEIQFCTAGRRHAAGLCQGWTRPGRCQSRELAEQSRARLGQPGVAALASMGWSRFQALYRYDPRGCGLSDRDAHDLSFEKLVSDLETIVRFGRVGAVRATRYVARRVHRDGLCCPGTRSAFGD